MTLRLGYNAEVYEKISYEKTTQFLEAYTKRETAKVERLFKKANFLQEKSLSSFQWHEQIHFSSQIDAEELVTLHFIARKGNVILTG